MLQHCKFCHVESQLCCVEDRASMLMKIHEEPMSKLGHICEKVIILLKEHDSSSAKSRKRRASSSLWRNSVFPAHSKKQGQFMRVLLNLKTLLFIES